MCRGVLRCLKTVTNSEHCRVILATIALRTIQLIAACTVHRLPPLTACFWLSANMMAMLDSLEFWLDLHANSVFKAGGKMGLPSTVAHFPPNSGVTGGTSMLVP